MSHECREPAAVDAAQVQLNSPLELVHLEREVIIEWRNCRGEYHGVRVTRKMRLLLVHL
jgi:hypothetical protein